MVLIETGTFGGANDHDWTGIVEVLLCQHRCRMRNSQMVLIEARTFGGANDHDWTGIVEVLLCHGSRLPG